VLHLIVALGDTRKAFELLEQSMSVKSSILTALDCLTIVNSLELKLLLAQFVIGRKHIQNNDPALVERIQHTHVVVLSLKMLIGLSSSSPSSSSSNTCTTSLTSLTSVTSVTSMASSVAASSTLSTQYRHLIGKPDVLVESLLLGKCMYK
jgi:hypothetical protein